MLYIYIYFSIPLIFGLLFYPKIHSPRSPSDADEVSVDFPHKINSDSLSAKTVSVLPKYSPSNISTRNTVTSSSRNAATSSTRNITASRASHAATSPTRNNTTSPTRNAATSPTRNTTTSPPRNNATSPTRSTAASPTRSTPTSPVRSTPTVKVSLSFSRNEDDDIADLVDVVSKLKYFPDKVQKAQHQITELVKKNHQIMREVRQFEINSVSLEVKSTSFVDSEDMVSNFKIYSSLLSNIIGNPDLLAAGITASPATIPSVVAQLFHPVNNLDECLINFIKSLSSLHVESLAAHNSNKSDLELKAALSASSLTFSKVLWALGERSDIVTFFLKLWSGIPLNQPGMHK